jgi:hypothetical protein
MGRQERIVGSGRLWMHGRAAEFTERSKMLAINLVATPASARATIQNSCPHTYDYTATCQYQYRELHGSVSGRVAEWPRPDVRAARSRGTGLGELVTSNVVAVKRAQTRRRLDDTRDTNMHDAARNGVAKLREPSRLRRRAHVPPRVLGIFCCTRDSKPNPGSSAGRGGEEER